MGLYAGMGTYTLVGVLEEKLQSFVEVETRKVERKDKSTHSWYLFKSYTHQPKIEPRCSHEISTAVETDCFSSTWTKEQDDRLHRVLIVLTDRNGEKHDNNVQYQVKFLFDIPKFIAMNGHKGVK